MSTLYRHPTAPGSSSTPIMDLESLPADALQAAHTHRLKRAPSSSLDKEVDTRRKKLRDFNEANRARASGTLVTALDSGDQDECIISDSGDDSDAPPPPNALPAVPAGDAALILAEDLGQELKCGCCTEICYNPVMVSPCQHFFCGSCCVLWIQSGGANCPTCRSVANSVSPCRPLHAVLDILLRHAPALARTEREKSQADDVYKVGSHIRLPSPKQPSPEPNVSQSATPFARPCPHCVPGNQWGWRCPQPIPDPESLGPNEHAVNLDEGTPTGHAYCGNCDHLHAVAAPTSSKCDFCQTSFCGIGVPGRCAALGLLTQQPYGFSTLSDLIQAAELYDLFDHNPFEVEILLEYMRTQDKSPRVVYSEIIEWTLAQPQGVDALVTQGLFGELIPSTPAAAAPPRTKTCRECAGEIFLHCLRPWWIRERRKGLLDPAFAARPDCKVGSACERQADIGHAKEFNHVVAAEERHKLAVSVLDHIDSQEPQTIAARLTERAVDMPGGVPWSGDAVDIDPEALSVTDLAAQLPDLATSAAGTSVLG